MEKAKKLVSSGPVIVIRYRRAPPASISILTWYQSTYPLSRTTEFFFLSLFRLLRLPPIPMASNSNVSVTEEAPNLSLMDLPIPPALKFLISSIKIVSNNMLSSDNYLIWSTQIIRLFAANGFMGFLDGSCKCPDQFLDSASNINPAFSKWVLIDQNLSAALYSTISPSILPYIMNLDTVCEIWNALSRRFQATNRSRIIQLRTQLHQTSMKSSSMQEYLMNIKSVVDHLAAAGSSVDHEDVILYTLNGLPQPYNAFKAAIRTRAEPVALDEFYALLCSEEANVKNEQLAETNITSLFSYQNRGGRGFNSNRSRGRGRYDNQRGRASNSTHNGGNQGRGRNSTYSATTCQICGRYGHSAQNCWHRSNLNYTPVGQQNYSASTSPSIVAGNDQSYAESWVLDSGASAHLTPNYNQLQQPIPYNGSDQITVGNGSSIPISNSGNGLLPTPSGDGSELQSALVELTGQRMVPSIFIGGNHIGGKADLLKKDKEGYLITLLKEAGALPI